MSDDALELLRRIRNWDMLGALGTADGPYWRAEIDKVLFGATQLADQLEADARGDGVDFDAAKPGQISVNDALRVLRS
jgi:hypothetical protein